MSIVIILLFKIVHSKTSMPLLQALFVFAAVIVATYAITFSKTLETFSSDTTAKIQTASVQVDNDVKTRAQGITNVSSEMKTDPVFSNMVVYVSAVENGFINNSSGHYVAKNPNKAGDQGNLVIPNSIPILDSPEYSFMLLNNINSDYATNGISMKSQTVTGPKSMELGYSSNGGRYIDGTSSYSIFWYAKNTGLDFTIPPGSDTTATSIDLPPVNYFTLHGISANSSVAARCYLNVNISPNQTTGNWDKPVVNTISLNVQHSDKDSLSYFNKTLNDFVQESSQFLFDRNYHLYTFVRDQTQIYLYIDNILVASSKLIDNTMAQLSNKEFVWNDNGNWDGYLMMFGVYDKALTINDINLLIKHIDDVVAETSDPYLYATNTLAQTTSNLTKSMECPFKGQAFCTSKDCADMTDWRFPQNLILNEKNAACLKDVISYCNSGTNASSSYECGLWTQNTQTLLAKLLGDTHETASGNISSTTIINGSTNEQAQQMINKLAGVNISRNSPAVRYLEQAMQNTNDPATKAQIAAMIAKQTATSDSVEINLNNQAANDLNSSFAALQSDVNSNTFSHLRNVGENMDLTPSLVSNIGNNSTLTDDQKYQQILSLYKADVLKKQTGGSGSGGFFAWIENLLGM